MTGRRMTELNSVKHSQNLTCSAVTNAVLIPSVVSKYRVRQANPLFCTDSVI
jgi:hypothetical protein